MATLSTSRTVGPRWAPCCWGPIVIRPTRTGWRRSARFNARLTGIKGFHRLCDGVQTLLLVDLQGKLFRMADIEYWADQVQGSEPPSTPARAPFLAMRRRRARVDISALP